MTNIINEKIQEKKVIVIDQTGKNIGLIDTAKALSMAEDAGLDLVVMQDKKTPYVCKIMDYNRAQYEQKKKDKERKKLQKVIETKTIQLSYSIDVGDFSRKVEKAREELKEGNKILVTLRLRGREIAYARAGLENVVRFCEELSDVGVVTKAANLESRTVSAMVEAKKER